MGDERTLLWRIVATDAPAAVILIRLMVGAVFFSEGVQKFLYPGEVGAGRFAKIGIPSPEVMAPFVGVVEIVCGLLLIVGLLTRLAAIPLIINMLVAILSTKIPILLGYGFWGNDFRGADRLNRDCGLWILNQALGSGLYGSGSWVRGNPSDRERSNPEPCNPEPCEDDTDDRPGIPCVS